jgi:hypothetical protein
VSRAGRYVSGLIVGCLLIPATVTAHHSVNAFFDLSSPQAVEGTLTSIRWANPHVRLQMERVGESGELELLEIDSGGPTLLHRLGVTADIVSVGDRVTISGFPSKRRGDEMLGASMSLADGREVPLFPTLADRFGHELRSGVHITNEDAAAGSRDARGIFRTWTVGRGGNEPADEPVFTASALQGQAAFDPLTDDPALSCIAQGMPILMDNPFPIQFVDRTGRIELHFEVWDAVRTIHLGESAAPASTEFSALGYSVGHWEGNALIVTTSHIDWPYYDDIGTPQSRAIEVRERFTLSAAEDRLDYQAVITDPATTVEPAVRNLHWLWVPGERLQSYNCTLSTNSE